jgi:hypothetical protein
MFLGRAESVVTPAEPDSQGLESDAHKVRTIYLACAVPEANHKAYALDFAGSSSSMGMGGPRVLVAHEAPLAVRRADLRVVVERLQADPSFIAASNCWTPCSQHRTRWLLASAASQSGCDRDALIRTCCPRSLARADSPPV